MSPKLKAVDHSDGNLQGHQMVAVSSSDLKSPVQNNKYCTEASGAQKFVA